MSCLRYNSSLCNRNITLTLWKKQNKKKTADIKTQYMTKGIKLIQHADDAILPLRDKQ